MKTNKLLLLVCTLLCITCLVLAACTPTLESNAITGLRDITLNCGDSLPALNATATNGTVTFGIAKAVDGTAKEDLTYAAIGTDALTAGTYYIKASVDQTETHVAAVSYITVTVNHLTFDAIQGDATTVAPDGTNKGYQTKTCACGEAIRGGKEFVTVTIKVDGSVVDTQTVEVGSTVADIDSSKLPVREGYANTLVTADGKTWYADDVINDFTTLELKSSWQAENMVELTEMKFNWLFYSWEILGNPAHEGKESKLTHDTDKGVYVVNTKYNESYKISPAELYFPKVELKPYHSYTLTFRSTQGCFIWFAQGALFETHAMAITDADANKDITVTFTYDGSTVYVNQNGQQTAYSAAEWGAPVLNTLFVQDKPYGGVEFAKQGERYDLSFTDKVTVRYDYMAEANAALAVVPTDTSKVDASNAEQIVDAVNAFNKIRDTYFSDAEKANARDLTAVYDAAYAIASDHNFNLNKIAAELPEFSTILTADQATQDLAFDALTRYLAYYNVKFTAEEKAAYSEPKEISFYREFFKARTLITKTAMSSVNSSFGTWTDESGTLHLNPNNASGDVTLPAIAYAAFDRVVVVIATSSATGMDETITYGDVSLTGAHLWGQFTFVKEADGWYVKLSKVGEDASATGVKLADDVAVGAKGLTFTFTNKEWGWLKVLSGTGTYNTIEGTFSTEGAVDVKKVTYNYTIEGGDKTYTEYYLAGEKLALYADGCVDYTDVVGKHTFLGFFADSTQYNGGETVDSDIVLTAKYEVKEGDYAQYTVLYLDAEGNEIADAQTYRYNAALVLPADPVSYTDAQGRTWLFKAWIDDSEKIWNAGDKVLGNLDLIAKFILDAKYNVTLTNLDGEDVVVATQGGEKVVVPATVARDGFILAGWTTVEGQDFDVATTEIEGEITLVAKWLHTDHDLGAIMTAEQVKTYNKWDHAVEAADSTKTDTRGNAYAQTMTLVSGKSGVVSIIRLPATIFQNTTEISIGFEVVGNAAWSFSLDEFTAKFVGDYSFLNKNFNARIFKVGEGWKIEGSSRNTIDVPAYLITEDIFSVYFYYAGEMDLKMTEVRAYGICDYVAVANDAASRIANLAADATDATKLALYKEYMSARLCFTAYELAANKESDKVVALRNYLNGLGDTTIVASTHDALTTNMPNWSENPTQAFNPNNGTYTFVLPKIAYAMYNDVTMIFKGNSETAKWTIGTADNTVKGEKTFWCTIKVSKNESGKYIARVMDSSTGEGFDMELSKAVVNGWEGISLTLSADAWGWCWLGSLTGTTTVDNVIVGTIAK